MFSSATATPTIFSRKSFVWRIKNPTFNFCWTPETAVKCRRCGKREKFAADFGVTVETLPSTDEGVAWFVTAEGKFIFHAGDLNWWHWEGEDKAWNANMAADFKRYTEPLRGRCADLALLPLDPRLGVPYAYWGLLRFLELMDVRHLLCTSGSSRRSPMNFCGPIRSMPLLPRSSAGREKFLN